MATFAFAMNVSLDGYVDHEAFEPNAALFQHWTDEVRRVTGTIYGRRMYEIMRYWDEDRPGWGLAEQDYAKAWRAMPKWVVSHAPRVVGPRATLLCHDAEKSIRKLKAEMDGEISVLGPTLAHSLGELGLVDQYRMYLHPCVLGRGTPFFAGARPPLRLMTGERMGDDVIRLTYGRE